MLRGRMLIIILAGLFAIAGCQPLPAGEDTGPPSISDQPRSPFPAGGCLMSAGFSDERVIPERFTFYPRDPITLTWGLINDGCQEWPAGSKLVLVEGEAINGPTAGQEVVSAEPGESISLTILMRAPATPGFYNGHWQLSTDQNILFGPRIPVSIEVVSEDPPRQTGKPDLAITRVELFESFTEGLASRYDFNITVMNMGEAPAPASRLGCVIIENGISVSPFVPALETGESAEVSCHLPAAMLMEEGIYSLWVEVDTLLEIIEANESYNDRIFFFMVEEAYTITVWGMGPT